MGAGGDVATVTLDPAAESELSVKFGKGMSVKGKIGKDASWNVKAPELLEPPAPGRP